MQNRRIAAMKVALLNVKYSPNLGDGVIAECLEHALRATIPGADIYSCDLAGRTGYTPRAGRLRRAALAVLDACPEPLAALIERTLLRRTIEATLTPHYRRTLAGADAVVVGGGQLLADANLNFPTKLAAALAAAKTAGAVIAAHAVGVEGGWSPTGARLFREGFTGARLVAPSVRDEISAANWRAGFTDIDAPAPTVRHDPALLAARVYDTSARCWASPKGEGEHASQGGGGGRRAGLCITHHAALKLHSDDKTAFARSLAPFYRAVAAQLTADGWEVIAFTNGAAEDEALLSIVVGDEPATRPQSLTRAPRPVRPGDLVQLIGGFDAVAGHRLHANIIAYALGVPSIGLAWNRKMDGFFTLTDRKTFLLPGTPAAKDVATALDAATRRGIDASVRERIIADTAAGIAELANALKAAIQQRESRGATS